MNRSRDCSVGDVFTTASAIAVGVDLQIDGRRHATCTADSIYRRRADAGMERAAVDVASCWDCVSGAAYFVGWFQQFGIT